MASKYKILRQAGDTAVVAFYLEYNTKGQRVEVVETINFLPLGKDLTDLVPVEEVVDNPKAGKKGEPLTIIKVTDRTRPRLEGKRSTPEERIQTLENTWHARQQALTDQEGAI